MKKNILSLFLLTFFLFIISTISIGASSTTYFYSEAIKIEDPNIEILSYELLIDTTASKVENIIYLKNTSDKEIELNMAIPLDNEEIDIYIKDLVIKLNDLQVEYQKSDDGKYLIKTKISANSGKKIDIEYYTENDLQNARYIKCNFDNLKEKKVCKLKVDIKIDDKNIPLVEKIYPGHYTFKDNTISVEYYNYEVNTITKNIIVKKETVKNLLYGRESQLDDEDRNIINSWYTTGNAKVEEYYYSENPIVNNIIDYLNIKKGTFSYAESSEPLLYEISKNNSYPDDNDFYSPDLYGKNICIDYVETEKGIELYVDKVIDVKYTEYEEIITSELVKTLERTILQTKGSPSAYCGKGGAKIIFVGQGIDGENLNATEQEKISYINQINADLYIRIQIYDGKIEYITDEYGYRQRVGKGMVGYFSDNGYEIAKAFALCEWDELKSEEIYNNGYRYNYEPFYSSYKEYAKNYYNDYFKDCVIKVENEDIADKCEVPTVIQYIGNRINIDGKYVVDYFGDSGFYDSYLRGLVTANAALQTPEAISMLSANKQKNLNTKSEIENRITDLSIVDDEQKIQQNFKDEIEEIKKQEELEELQKLKDEEEKKIQEELQKLRDEEERLAKEKAEQQKEYKKHITVFSLIGLGIVLCILILIIEQIRIKKNKKGVC